MSIVRHNITILYVEDDDSIRDDLAESLQAVAQNVVVAANGAQGVEKFFEHQIDLIITDINMPIMNGFEMLLKIRESEPDTFAIVLSAYGHGDMLDGMSKIDKFNDYIQKPFKIQDLFGMIANNIHKKELYKQSQESNNLLMQYKRVLDKSAIFVKTNIHGIITYVNDEYCQVTGYTSEQMLGTMCHMLDNPTIHEKLWKSIIDQKEFRCQIKNQKANGETYFTDTMVFPIFDMSGKILEFSIISFDVTEHIEALLNAKNAEQAKSSFLAQMSHEIRTPLNGILGFTNILEKRDLPTEDKKYIKTIHSSATQLLHIINEILDFSKIENGKISLESINFAPYEEFLNVVQLFSKVAEEKGVALEFEYDKQIPAALISDPYRIKQVLSNLISNAVKFTPRGKKVSLIILLDAIRDSYAYLSFSVKDEGIGIKAEDQGKIFESFSQADESVARKYGGTGLGLAICVNIIKMLGSEIHLESVINEGSLFSFKLKLAVGSVQAVEEPNALVNNNKNYTGKVLIADDNSINRLLLQALLDAKGLTYTAVENGLEACAVIQHETFDLILMDINMPEMDGLSAMKEIVLYEKNNNLNHTPIVALTANSVMGDREKYIAEGFDDYLSKPIVNSEFEIMLYRYLSIDGCQVCYDGDAVANKLGLSSDILNMLIKQFFNELPTSMQKLSSAIGEKDFDKIRHQAHYIKGASGNLQLLNMSEILEQIEKQAKAKQEHFDYETLYKELELAANAYSEVLKKL